MRRLIIALALAAATPAAAQERSPELRQAVIDLARVLGESHALRQVCFGAGDLHWRTRMTSLVDNEQPDEVLAKRLQASFAAGVAAGRTAHPDCTPVTREAQAQAAERGRELAAQLAAAQRRVPGWMPSLPEEDAEKVTDDTSPG